jgi:hypothetical protein
MSGKHFGTIATWGLTMGEHAIVVLVASNAGRWVTYRAVYDQLALEGFI